jgi:hypothetical protein
MNRNLIGSIYRRSSIVIANFVLIHEQTWPPQAVIVFDWSISKNLLKQFQRRKFLEIDQSEITIACGDHVC